jgi:hypothetical protein
MEFEPVDCGADVLGACEPEVCEVDAELEEDEVGAADVFCDD